MSKASSRQPPSAYFEGLNAALQANAEAGGRLIPMLLLDLDALDQNMETLRRDLSGVGRNTALGLRLVVKSLPSSALLEYLARQLGTQRFMVFHQPFLIELSKTLGPEADVLLGKPMPVQTAAYFYSNLPEELNGFDPYLQIQWLVDTPQRIAEYQELASKLGRPLRLNFEIDVGLHRGGFHAEQMGANPLHEGLAAIGNSPGYATFSGFMGYEPHVVKLPRILRSRERAFDLANAAYRRSIELLQKEFPQLWSDDLTFNGGGSPTLTLHAGSETPINEVAVGSCMVKPTSFDIPTLTDYVPAAFIATPVLKAFTGTTLPALEWGRGLLNLLSGRNRRSYFIYGGFWKADYCWPAGLQENALFGPSTNQSMVNGPVGRPLEPDDFVFLRPRQSEFVFLQFGGIQTLRKGALQEHWTVLGQSV
jgi:D-serine deaminase-like pyridoxal phosphate-dependent protein